MGRGARLFGWLFVLALTAENASALNCQQVRQLTTLLLRNHYSHTSFDQELSKRTLENIFKNLDSGKLYFLESDIKEFREKYATKLDDQLKRSDCTAIADINNTFVQRFDQRHIYIAKTLIPMKHDFKIDESMSLDRKKMNYAANQNELNERWRKRVKFQFMQLQASLSDEEKVREKLAKRFANIQKWQKERTMDHVLSVFLNAFASALDPHSEYMMPEQLEDFRIDTRLSLEGIGASLSSEDGFTIIQSLIPGGGAAKTGLMKVEDKIIAVAQGDGEPVDVIDMQLRDVVRLIRGTAGTVVKLTLLREESGEAQRLVVPVIRAKIQLEDRIAKSKVYELNVKDTEKSPSKTMKIGVIELPSFYVDFEGMHQKKSDYRSSYRDTLNALNELKAANVDAVVMDLRSNGGGSLDESVKIAGLFFDQGPVVQVKDTDGRISQNNDPFKGVEYSGPLVVMINRQSASASEILAGAIKDYQRGVIVGDSHTFGKGTVQNLQDLGDKLGAIKTTISKFYRPSGSSTQLNGVASDVILPSVVDLIEIGEKHYDYALPWDQIPATKFSAVKLSASHIPTLKQRSEERVKKDVFFDQIREDIDKYKEEEKDRYVVSLKVDEKKDKDEDKKDEKVSRSDHNDKKLEDDPHLQEGLRIASDYARLLAKETPAMVEIPNLKPPATMAEAKTSKKDKNSNSK